MRMVAPLVFLIAASMVSSAWAQLSTDVHASATGAVAHPGAATYGQGVRLAAVAKAAGVKPGAYILGAAWLRPSLERDQLRQRAGLAYELGAIHLKASRAGNEVMADTALLLKTWIEALPVTGRRLSSDLDPATLEVTPADNWPVEDGDTLFYPDRPQGVRVVGAVRQACHLPLEPLQDARRYLRACPVSEAADPNSIYVVQPDGTVFVENVALWNRDPPKPIAPGAWIYVPFNERAIFGAVDDGFNKDFADFLATQLLSEDGWR